MMELTREEIEIFTKCGDKFNCEKCSHYDVCKVRYDDAVVIRTLATQLLSEMDKQKVWTYAPDNARYAIVEWYEDSGRARPLLKSTFYCRKPPKSRIDEIAEEAEGRYRRGAVGAGSLTDIIKSAILQARKEWEAER